MALREWVNENAALATIGVVVILVIALAVLISLRGRSVVTAGDAWFYDPVEQDFFRGSDEDLPPIESPWGNDAWKAVFFSCTEDCTEGQRFGYFERFDPEIKAEILRLKAQQEEAGQGGAEAGRLKGEAQDLLMSLTLKGKEYAMLIESEGIPAPGELTWEPPNARMMAPFLDDLRERCRDISDGRLNACKPN